MDFFFSKLRTSRISLRLTTLLLAASLLLRVMIPAGYMPGNLLAGEFMILCPQGLPATAVGEVHAVHAEHEGGADSYVNVDSACPIGSALILSATPPAVPLVLLLPSRAGPPEVAVNLFAGCELTRHYESRAPPRSDA